MTVPLAVVIPAAGRPELLRRTLDSLAECQLPAEYRGTFVVENGYRCGLDDVVARCATHLRAEYLFCEEPGRSAALNVGVDRAGDCLVYMTDDDMRLSPATLVAYAEAAAEHGRGAIFGGPLGVDQDVPPPPWLVPYLPPSAVGWIPVEPPGPDERPHFFGANWAAFTADLHEAGDFNPDKGTGARTGATGQESDMQQRLYGRGLKAVYVSEAMVWHYVPAERCSLRWALKRARRAGIEFGLDHADPAAWQGVPRWVWRQWLEHAGKWAATRLHPNQPVRFAAAHALARWGGVIRGCRLARHQKRKGNNA